MKSKKKIGVIFFHKDIRNIYKNRWIEKCVSSIANQTFNDFTIFEINYGGDDFSIIKEFAPDFKKSFFVSEKLENHAEAMNKIIDIAFNSGCDYVFNTNTDDYYQLDRIEKQLEFLNDGYDIVASDFCYIQENAEGDDDINVFTKKIKSFGDIAKNINGGHNVIAHPVVGYSKRFWESNRYSTDEIPREDLLLWKRSIANGFTFYIHDDVLLNYRLHSNQITGNNSGSNGGYGNDLPSQESVTNPNLRNTIYKD